MKRMFDFHCAKEHITEKYIDDTVMVIECPHCGNDASRLIGTPKIGLDPISGHFPDATSKWERNRQSHIAWERKTGRSDQWK
jgi:hypothetical protein